MKLGIIVCDSLPPKKELIEKSVNFLKDQNVDCYISDKSYEATTAELKVNLFNELLVDDSIDVIMPFWGGLKTIEMLPYLNFDLINKCNKPVVGYSDATVLLQAIASKTNSPTYHGPALITFAKQLYRQEALKSLKDALYEKKYTIPLIKEVNIQSDLSETPVLITQDLATTYNDGDSNGKTIVGNLQTLLLLNGTEYEMQLNGKILFIEEAEEADENWFRRYITQLTLMKDFGKLKGIIISKFTLASNIDKNKIIEILNDHSFNKLNFPVVINADFGHTDPIITIPNNAECTVSAYKDVSISFTKEK